jgi:hypothetical protein
MFELGVRACLHVLTLLVVAPPVHVATGSRVAQMLVPTLNRNGNLGDDHYIVCCQRQSLHLYAKPARRLKNTET